MTPDSCCRFIKPSSWQLEPRPWVREGCVQPEVLELISHKYSIRHVVDFLDIDLDIPLFRQVMHDVAVTEYQDNDRTVVLLHDTDYCEPQGTHGYSLYNFFKLCAQFEVPLERIILVTNHHGITAEITRLSTVICNSAPPLVIETVLWYDFPQAHQLEPLPAMGESLPQRLYVCPNNKHRRHRMFVLTCLADQALLEQGAVSYHFHHAS